MNQMNKYQRAYAVAKAHHDAIQERYYEILKNNAERQALQEEQYKLLDMENIFDDENSPEYKRCDEIETILMQQEKELDEQLHYTQAKQALQTAEEALVKWAFDQLKKQPQVFEAMGVSFADIEHLQSLMKDKFSKFRKELISLSFRYVG
jgi:hypothetical protein